MTLFILMPNFLLTTGGILSFTYAFILSFIDFDELSHYRKILTECLAISLGSLPVLLYFFSVFQPLSLLLTAIFSLAFDTLILPVLTFLFLLSPLVKITALNSFLVFLETIIKFSKSLVGTPLVFGRPSLGILLLLLLQ